MLRLRRPTATTAAPATPLVAALRRALRDDQVRDGRLERALYRHDASHMERLPEVVCFPERTDEVQACVRIAREHGATFVARGSGTGLAGGAVPPEHGIVISMSRFTEVGEVDALNRCVWVGPGALNLDVSRAVVEHGLHFAPDPSSQQSCSIGGNVANNSGGPHCLAEGVTSAHVLAIEVVLPDGELVVLDGGGAEGSAGYDLRGAFVGSEGMCGIATRVLVRLTPNPPDVRTLLLDFPTIEGASRTVSEVIAAGLVPAAMELMDQLCLEAVEAYVHAGLPVDAAAALLVEVVGLPHGLEADVGTVTEIGLRNGARAVRVAADDAERAVLWKARKSAFGAIARIKPDYYLHDTVVPRSALTEVLTKVCAIAARYDLAVLNVLHAGDGNLHPLLLFDARVPGEMERVVAAGREIVTVCVAAGGVLSGEHGIGLEKRDLMPLMFTDIDLEAQRALRSAFDPDELCNPDKVLPSPATCADVRAAVAAAGTDAWI